MKPSFGDLKQDSFDASQRQKYVTRLFDDLAPSYDRFNRWVSFSRDEAWRAYAVDALREMKQGNTLDLAAGTGDLARSALQGGAQSVHVFDISFNMLTHAKQKLGTAQTDGTLAFEQGSAHRLPFKDGTFHGVVSGFAMRNVFHFLDDVLSEMHRVLKPGGRFAILELTQPENQLLKLGFRAHLQIVMPLIGKLTSGTTTPFNYLRQTTMTFLTPVEFQQRLEKAGFRDVTWKSFLFGGIAVHCGEKK